MRTHYDSIVNVFVIKQNSEIKTQIAKNVLAKIETKSVSKTNEYGERGFQKENKIYIERKTVKELTTIEFDDSELLVQRIKAGRFEVDEWYQVEGAIQFEGKSLTIELTANRKSKNTDTNNGGFGSI